MQREVKNIAIYGAGGFGREVACLLRKINMEVGPQWNLIGFFDDGAPVGSNNEYGTVLGNMETLNAWTTPLAVVFAIGSPKVVEKLHKKVANDNIYFPNIIAPDTLFLDSDNVTMGIGNVICSRCVISTNIAIGNFNTFNGSITIGHDARIGDYNSIMPATKISGGVRIGNRNFMGVNSVILQYKSLGDDAVIGAASVVIRNIKIPGTYVGNPAKRIVY